MVKWDLTAYQVDIRGASATRIWAAEGAKTKSWDDLKQMANNGWELVNVTPIACDGTTYSLLYTFKRPKQ